MLIRFSLANWGVKFTVIRKMQLTGIAIRVYIPFCDETRFSNCRQVFSSTVSIALGWLWLPFLFHCVPYLFQALAPYDKDIQQKVPVDEMTKTVVLWYNRNLQSIKGFAPNLQNWTRQFYFAINGNVCHKIITISEFLQELGNKVNFAIRMRVTLFPFVISKKAVTVFKFFDRILSIIF